MTPLYIQREKIALVMNIGTLNHLVLRNHGILSCGTSIPEMFMNTWLLQRACEVKCALDASGQKPKAIDAHGILKKSAELVRVQNSGVAIGQLEFAAMVRKVDKLDSSYNDL